MEYFNGENLRKKFNGNTKSGDPQEIDEKTAHAPGMKEDRHGSPTSLEKGIFFSYTFNVRVM